MRRKWKKRNRKQGRTRVSDEEKLDEVVIAGAFAGGHDERAEKKKKFKTEKEENKNSNKI